MAVWIFVPTEAGDFARVPLKHFEDFLAGRRPMRPNDGRFVRYVLLGLHTRKRIPLAINHVEFSRVEVDERGLHTEDLRLQQRRTAMMMVSEHGERAQQRRQRPDAGNIVPVQALLADRKFRWRPTDQDRRRLREAIIEEAAGFDITGML